MSAAAPILTYDGALTLAITLLALLLFVWNRFRVDVVALAIMLVLIVSGIVTPQQGISGFAHEATITVALMLVLGAGLLRTGSVHRLARWMGRLAGPSSMRLLVLTIAIVLPLSAVINNTAAVAVLLPVLLGLSRQGGFAPSSVLMPLSFAGQLGGTLTLVGTSTNLLVAGLVLDLGVQPIQLFDITPPALVVCTVGVLYLLTLGRWLMPHRDTPADLLESYELHDYLTALRVLPESKMIGRSLAETRFGATLGLQVMRVTRADGEDEVPRGATVLRAGDVLIVEGKIRNIAQVERLQGLERVAAEPLLAPRKGDTLRLAEVLVPRRADAVRHTIRELDLRARFGVSAVGVRRHATALHEPLAETRLQPGDMLLVQGTKDALQRLHAESDLVLLGPVNVPPVREERMWLAVAIVAGVIGLPAFGVTTIVVSALAGVVAMLVTGCITPDEAYSEIDWMVIVLLGAVLPLGVAMHATGTAGWIAHGLLGVLEPLGAHGVLVGVLVATTALTSIISNAAAAAVLAPIAVSIATSLEVSPLPFVIAVMLAASSSFLSPVGYQTNTMVYSPGGYRFADFLRVGGPLTLLVIIAATVAVPIFFPFR